MRFTDEMRGNKMIDEIYFLEEEKEKAYTVIERILKLREDLQKKRNFAFERSSNVAGYDEKINLCNTRILKEKAKIQYLNNILKFIHRNK